MSNQARSEGDFDALRVLIDCMEQMTPLTPAELNGLHEDHHEIFDRMIETGETWNQASSGLTFLSLNQNAYREHMRKIDNDLGEQTAIVSQSFARYLETGEIPAPYYSWRIAVILRRAREPELEKRFLAAWCLHFPSGNGQRYAQLIDRYQKLL